MPEEKARCNWCRRDGIVVDSTTGWLFPHRTKNRSRKGKGLPQGRRCKGSERHRDSQPEVSNA
jgi:hypothetical protein